jgi:predicted DNA-binding WGR domain protein
MRTFEYRDEKSSKFWNIELQGDHFTVTYGKIGTKGSTTLKEYPGDEAKARKEHDKLVAEKTGKGYKETTPAAAPAPAPAAAAPAPAAEPAKKPKAAASKKTKPAAAPAAPVAVAPPPPPPPAPAPAASGPRKFVFQEGTSHKFWHIELQGSTVTTTYG